MVVCLHLRQLPLGVLHQLINVDTERIRQLLYLLASRGILARFASQRLHSIGTSESELILGGFDLIVDVFQDRLTMLLCWSAQRIEKQFQSNRKSQNGGYTDREIGILSVLESCLIGEIPGRLAF